MKVNELEFKNAVLLPAKAGTCSECATEHEKGMPHNQQSLYYQYSFYQREGRFPTWEDAMSHCDEQVQATWTRALREVQKRHQLESNEVTKR